MEIFETFGLDWYLAIAQIVNFVVIFFILKRFLYKPLFNLIKKREDLVKETVEKSQASEEALATAEKQEKEIIKKAQVAAKQMIADAKEQAVQIVKDAEVAAKKQTDTMVKEAKVQIEQETEQAQAQLNKYVSKLSIDLLKKSLSNVFTEKEQSEILERALKEMQKRPN